MSSYAKPLPIDRNLNAMTFYPPNASAIGTTFRDNGGASSVTSFNPNTTTIEVAAIGSPVAIKWASSQATSVIGLAGTANFDHIVPAGTVRPFVVPRTVQGAMASTVGLATIEGLFNAVGTINLGVGSVALTQY